MNSFTVPASELLVKACQPKLVERMYIHLRKRYYSIRTKQAYIDWLLRSISLSFTANAIRRMGRGLGRSVPEPFGGGKTGIGIYPEPSQVGDPVFAQASFR